MANILLKARLALELPPINAALERAAQGLPEPVRPVARHIFEAGGKRLRPLLTVLTARLLGYERADIYDLAVTMEMLHAATLLHDDVLDNAVSRRGKPAAHTLFEVTPTILAGDALLAEQFGCPVVGDFRVRDMAAGGLGAPLVPYTEFLLYRSETECVALQNIGGIGNISFLPAGCGLNDVLAFDTGPGNMVIDALTAQLTGGAQSYDDGGRLAAAGRVSPELLGYMLDDGYLRRCPPKTTGREAYGPDYVARLLHRAEELSVPLGDALATATRFTAECIAAAVRDFAPQPPAKLIVGGGGCMNQTLMGHIAALLPGCAVMTNEALGYDSNAKEAVAFAILANEAVFAHYNNAPSATGAKHPVVMGRISL